MKRYWGIFVLIPVLLLGGPAPPACGQAAIGPAPGSVSGRIDRRDLGEKGQIIIESLDLNEADLADVVRLLARISGINIITGELRGSITVYLENVTVQAALTAILASQGYGYIFDGNIVRVVDAAKLGEDRVETITETFLLNYLPADTVADNLRKVFSGNTSGSSFSQIEANIEANAIIVVDIPRRVADIRKLIDILDRRFEQVEIEGRFVEISYTQDQEWGIDWKYFQDPANTLDVNLAPLPLNAANAAGQFRFAIINGRDNLTGFLQALETNNDIRILADPKILALENKEATIELIDEIPFVEANVSQGVVTESVQFQETGIRLVVTPQIAEEPDGTYVRMKLELEQRIPGPNVILQNSIAFPIDSRHAMSELIVPDDSTVIIGGLRSNDLTYTYEKIPLIGNIPLLGKAFQRRAKLDDQKELLLFVTPRVIYDHPPLDCKEQELHDKMDEVADSLETQSAWRETVEAPYELLEKDVLYSGVENNPDIYARILAEKKALERVKPYKVSKPKGHRRLRIRTENGVLKEEVIEPEGPIEESAVPPPGEVRDFSAIEEKAGPGVPRPESELVPPPEELTPPLPPVILPPPAIEEAPIPPPPQRQREDRPSWLRRGARDTSAADEVEQDSEHTSFGPPGLDSSDPYSIDEDSIVPEQPPTSVGLADEIPFAPIESELHEDETRVAPADVDDANGGEGKFDDPWQVGLSPAIKPLSPPAQASPAPISVNQLADEAGLAKWTEVPAEKGFIPVVEVTPRIGGPNLTKMDQTIPSPERPAALLEAERLQKVCDKAVRERSKSDFLDKSKILAYNDSASKTAPEPPSSPPKDRQAWWRKLIPRR